MFLGFLLYSRNFKYRYKKRGKSCMSKYRLTSVLKVETDINATISQRVWHCMSRPSKLALSFLSVTCFTDDFQYQDLLVDTNNISQGDQRKHIQITDKRHHYPSWSNYWPAFSSYFLSIQIQICFRVVIHPLNSFNIKPLEISHC